MENRWARPEARKNVLISFGCHISWTCNFYGKPGGAGGSGYDLEDCQRQFKVAWVMLRAALTDADIAKAYEMRR